MVAKGKKDDSDNDDDVRIHVHMEGDDSDSYFSDSDAESIEQVEKNIAKRSAGKKSKDLTSFYIYITIIFGSFFASGYFIVNRNRFYRIDTMDSWGNKCGRPNVAIDGVPQSGRNMTDQKYTLFFSTISLKKVMIPEKRSDQHYLRFCVKKCPEQPISCSQLIQENGYSSVQATVDKYKSCEAYQKTILPYYTGDYSCVPKVIHTMHGEDQTFTSDFSKGFHPMTIGAISNFDQLYHNSFKILVLCSVALSVAFTATLIIRKWPYWSLYYLFFVGIHAALIAQIVCWVRLFFIDSGESPEEGAEIADFLKTHEKTPISSYGGSGSYSVTTTKSIDEVYSISSAVDRAAYATMGAIMLAIMLLLCFKAFTDLRPVKIKMICLLVQMVNYILPRAPLLGLLPVICIWPHLCFYNFWTILSYFIYLPKQLWLDEESGIVVLNSEMPIWQSIVLFVMTYIFWWVIDTAHCAQSLFTCGCVSELYFSEEGLRPDAKKSISYSRWVRRVYFMFGQVCAFSFVNTFGAIIQIVAKILPDLNYKKNCALCRTTCCASCGDDFKPVFAMDNRALVSVAIFGDSFYVAVQRTNLLLDRRGQTYRDSLVMFDTLMVMVRFGTASVVALIALITELPPVSFGEYDSLTLPYLTCFLLSSTVAKIVMNTYTAMADAIYLCYCIDMEVNNGSDFPYFAPPVYQEIVAMVEDLQLEIKGAAPDGQDEVRGEGETTATKQATSTAPKKATITAPKESTTTAPKESTTTAQKPPPKRRLLSFKKKSKGSDNNKK